MYPRELIPLLCKYVESLHVVMNDYCSQQIFAAIDQIKALNKSQEMQLAVLGDKLMFYMQVLQALTQKYPLR